MKRLTKRNIHGVPYYPECFDKCAGKGPSIKCHCCYFEHEIIIKLAEYEDLEEQGRLLVLPCKVGDKLYLLQENNRKHEVVEVEVDRFEYAKYRVPRLEIYFTNASGFETCLLDGTLNEGVFLTKAKAEKALAEMGE